MKVFAARVKYLRGRAGMSQDDLVEASGLSKSFLSMIERGQRAPSYDTLQVLARAFGVPLAELFRGETEPPLSNVHHQKLVDFARRAALSRKQVDQLIAVGRALFEVSR